MSFEKEREANIEKGVVGSEGVDFGGDTSLPPPPTLTEEEEKRLWRKVDLRLMPILALMYLLSFMDRGDLYFGRFGLRSLTSVFEQETSVTQEFKDFRLSLISPITSSTLRW